MIHIKYLILVLLVAAYSFYQSSNIGADKMGMHRVAVEALPRIDVKEISNEEACASILHEQSDIKWRRQVDALKTYGMYLDSLSFHAPDVNGLDAHTKSFMREIVKIVLEKEPEFFTKNSSFYDSVIEEYENSNKQLSEEYMAMKKQLKLVENELKIIL